MTEDRKTLFAILSFPDRYGRNKPQTPAPEFYKDYADWQKNNPDKTNRPKEVSDHANRFSAEHLRDKIVGAKEVRCRDRKKFSSFSPERQKAYRDLQNRYYTEVHEPMLRIDKEYRELGDEHTRIIASADAVIAELEAMSKEAASPQKAPEPEKETPSRPEGQYLQPGKELLDLGSEPEKPSMKPWNTHPTTPMLSAMNCTIATFNRKSMR